MKKMLNIMLTGLVGCALCTAATSCSDKDDVEGDPQYNWAGTTQFFNPTDEQGFSTYYTPAIGRVGDPMPFYDKASGMFRVLYLQEYDNNASHRFHPYWTVQTPDGANYMSLGETLAVGSNDYQQDAALGTGCCYYNEKDGLYYIYYTGHNGNAKYREAVMRATSPDYINWSRDELWQLNGPDYGYSSNDFRDPQVFVADDGLYHMVISTYPASGGDPCFAEFRSADMKTWEHVGRFPMIWSRMLECPDIFKMGDWWYLVYSDSNQQPWSRKVKYKKAATYEMLKGSFGGDAGEVALDNRSFYAGKTASNGTDRFIWGWCPFRYGANIHEKNVNHGGAWAEPAWSGAMVCHKVIQHEDGSLTLGAVPAMAAKYNVPQPVAVMASNGYSNGTLTGDGAYVLYNRLGAHNHITFKVKTAGNGDNFGVSFVRGSDSEKYYSLVVAPDGDGRVIHMEQEGVSGIGEIKDDGQALTRGSWFAQPADNVFNVDIYTDNSVLVMYINNVACYTQRIYGIQKNCWSINNYGGSIAVSDVTVWQY